MIGGKTGKVANMIKLLPLFLGSPGFIRHKSYFFTVPRKTGLSTFSVVKGGPTRLRGFVRAISDFFPVAVEGAFVSNTSERRCVGRTFRSKDAMTKQDGEGGPKTDLDNDRETDGAGGGEIIIELKQNDSAGSDFDLNMKNNSADKRQ